MEKSEIENSIDKEQLAEGVHLKPEVEADTRERVRELKDPIKAILDEVAEKIYAGKYQLIIGDDASGRIPTLIMRKVINHMNHAQGQSEITTRFIAGTRGYDAEDPGYKQKKDLIASYIKKLHAEIGDLSRALVVTDTILSGKSLQPLAESLNEEGILFDIVTVSNAVPVRDEDEVRNRLTRDFMSSTLTETDIYSKPHLTGVAKDKFDLHAHRSDPDELAFWFGDPSEIDHKEAASMLRQNMTVARDEANKVADEIIEYFEDKDAGV